MTRTNIEELYHKVEKAFLFIGYIEKYKGLYRFLQRAGYTCIFKPTIPYKDRKIKGNCDAELVLHAMIEYDNYDQAVIVTGDGDFYCLITYFIKQKKLKKLLIPNQKQCSALLMRLPSGYLALVSDLRDKLAK